MKKILLFLILACLFFLPSFAQSQYVVTAESSLNVRSAASSGAGVIGKLQKGDKITVLYVSNGWARIDYNGRAGYVTQKYIKQCPSQSTTSQNEKKESNFSFSSFDLDKYATGDVEWMIFVIAALLLILRVLYRIFEKDVAFIQSNRTLLAVFFLIIVGLELVYLIMMGSDAIWFCMPDTVGWLWAIIGFCAFGYIIFAQLMCLAITIAYSSDINLFEDCKWGVYSWIGFAIAGVIMGFADWGEYAWILITALGICQLIQMYLIYKEVYPYQGVLWALLCILIYILGSIATMWMIVCWVMLLIIIILCIVIGLFVLKVFFSSSGSDTTYVDRDGNRYKRI